MTLQEWLDGLSDEERVDLIVEVERGFVYGSSAKDAIYRLLEPTDEEMRAAQEKRDRMLEFWDSYAGGPNL